MTRLDPRLSTVVGTGLLLVAALALVSSAFEQLIPMDGIVDLFGNDYLLLAVVATLLVTGLLGVVVGRAILGVTEAKPPSVETVRPESPGRTVDQSLESLPPVRTTDGHRRIHDRLRQATVDAVAASTRGSPAGVRDAVESGSWTDDATAANFVASETLDPPTVATRCLARVRGRDWFRHRVMATVTALESFQEDKS